MLAGLFLSLPTPTDLRVSTLPSAPAGGSGVAVRAERVILRAGKGVSKATLVVAGGVVVSVGQDLPVPDGNRIVGGAVGCAGFVDPWAMLGLDPGSTADL